MSCLFRTSHFEFSVETTETPQVSGILHEGTEAWSLLSPLLHLAL
jgi:hypothetical protein